MIKIYSISSLMLHNYNCFYRIRENTLAGLAFLPK
jgi:hypothetical protein